MHSIYFDVNSLYNSLLKCTFTLSEFLGFEGSIGTRLTLVSGKMELVIFPAIGLPFIGPEDFLLTSVGLFVRMHSIVVLLLFCSVKSSCIKLAEQFALLSSTT